MTKKDKIAELKAAWDTAKDDRDDAWAALAARYAAEAATYAALKAAEKENEMSVVEVASRYAFHTYAEHDLLNVYEHSEAVVHLMGDYGPIFHIVGYLHDIVEDTPVTLDDIGYEFGPVVRYAVDCMTRREDERYWQEYLPRLKVSPVAHIVKYFDAKHNHSRPRVWGWSDAKVDALKLKYLKVMRNLEW